MKTIQVEIDTSGNSEVTMKGACGSECEGLVSPIQSALGKTVKSGRTPDYNRRSQSSSHSQAATR